MASINGFKLKNVKKPLGREGYGCIGTIYLNNKKMGTYEDYGDGAMEEVTYVSKEAEEEMTKFIIEYAKKHPSEYIANLYKVRPQQYEDECKRFKKVHPYIKDEDITIETMSANSIVFVVEAFLELFNIEKDFKKYIKKGYRAISIDKDIITAYPNSWTDEQIKKEANGQTLYMSLDDLDI